jgi:hypothetical protein
VLGQTHGTETVVQAAADFLAVLITNDVGGMGQRAIGGKQGGLDGAQTPAQVAVTLLADHEGAAGGQKIGVDLATVAAAVDDPDAAPLARLGHRRHGGLQLGVLADEVGRTLGVQRTAERHDGVVLVLHRDHLAQPVAGGDRPRAAVAHAGQVLHLLGVGLGDVGDVEDQKGALADAARTFAQHRRRHVVTQLRPPQVA